jgi:hypothetical protein
MPASKPKRPRKPTIEHVKTRHEMKFMNIEGVQGVGIGEQEGKPVIKVYVSRKTPALKEKVPTSLEGYPVHVETTGEFHAL